MTAASDDRATARELRRLHALDETVIRLRRLNWGPTRIAAALELAESYVFTVATGRQPTHHRIRPSTPELGEIAANLSTAMAAALHSLVLESRGLWPVDIWPTPAHTVQALVDRKLARVCRDGTWEPSRDGVEADALRHRGLRAPVTAGNLGA